MVPVDAGAETVVEAVEDTEAIASAEEGATDVEVTIAEVDGAELDGELDTAGVAEAEKVKSSLESGLAVSHELTSRFPLLSKRQVLAWFVGTSGIEELAPVNVKSCEVVTFPLPSARPPQENSMTWLPAARRGSKFKHP